MDTLARHAPALQTDQIEPASSRARSPPTMPYGNHVVRHAGHAADEGVSADAAKLLHGRQARRY